MCREETLHRRCRFRPHKSSISRELLTSPGDDPSVSFYFFFAGLERLRAADFACRDNAFFDAARRPSCFNAAIAARERFVDFFAGAEIVDFFRPRA